IVVKAAEVGVSNHNDSLTTLTDQSGKYAINGLDPKKKYTVIASPYPETGDDRFGFGFNGTRYGELRRSNVSPADATPIDFRLKPATGSISGHIRTPDGGALI